MGFTIGYYTNPFLIGGDHWIKKGQLFDYIEEERGTCKTLNVVHKIPL